MESKITILYDSTCCVNKHSQVEERFMTVAYKEHPQTVRNRMCVCVCVYSLWWNARIVNNNYLKSIAASLVIIKARVSRKMNCMLLHASGKINPLKIDSFPSHLCNFAVQNCLNCLLHYVDISSLAFAHYLEKCIESAIYIYIYVWTLFECVLCLVN